MLQAVDSTNEVHDFLDWLYSNLTGWIYVPTKDPNSSDWHQEYFQWPAQRDDAIAFIEANTTAREVYIAPAMFSKPSGLKEDFAATNVVWVDFDGNAPKQSDPSAGLNVPSLVVQSSKPGHEHWYWRLAQPITEVTHIESLTKWLAYEFDGDYGCWNANRVLRPPSTLNHKRDATTFIKNKAALAYGADSFNSEVILTVDDAEQPASVIPDVADVILTYAWPQEAINLYRSKDPSDRSDALMALGYYCAEMGMADAEIYSVVRNADDRWGKFKGRSDRHKRLIDLVSRVRIKHPAREINDNVIPVFGWHSLLQTEITLEWVIEGLLEANGYLLTVGPSGVGKTQWSLRWAMNLARGLNYLGYEAVKPQKILFISAEMNHAGIKYFMEIMSRGLSVEDLAILEENVVVAPIGEPLHLDTPDGQRVLTDLVKFHNPDGLIFDSVGSATSGDISQEGPTKALMGFNDHLRVTYDIWTWYIHHQRKAQGDNKKPNKLDDVYGNQFLYNRATTVVLLWPAKDKIEITYLKIRLAEMTDPYHIQRLPDLDFIRLQEVKLVPKTITYKPSPGVPVDLDLYDDPLNAINKKGQNTSTPEPPPETTNLQGLM